MINAGVPGYNTEQEALLLAELMPKYRPDMVVLGYVMNDAEPQMNVPQPPAATYRHASLVDVGGRPRGVHAQARGDPDWTSPNKLVPSFDYVEGFARTAASGAPRKRRSAASRRRAGLRACRCPSSSSRTSRSEFDASYPDGVIHRAVAEWSRELGADVVDLMPMFQGQDHRQFMILVDGHPNARAHEMIAGVLARPGGRRAATSHRPRRRLRAPSPASSSGRR